jgi:hypothetical protein
MADVSIQSIEDSRFPTYVQGRSIRKLLRSTLTMTNDPTNPFSQACTPKSKHRACLPLEAYDYDAASPALVHLSTALFQRYFDARYIIYCNTSFGYTSKMKEVCTAGII